VMLPFWYSRPVPDAKGKAAVSSYSKLSNSLKILWNESKHRAGFAARSPPSDR
jgi:hypothetical protein